MYTIKTKKKAESGEEIEESFNIVEYVDQTFRDFQHKDTRNRNYNDYIELTIICSSNQKNILKSKDIIKVGDTKCILNIISGDDLLKIVQNIACFHFHLRCIRITGIPMKTDSDKGRNTYDVLLFHPADNHSLSYNSQCDPLSFIESSEITLQWKMDKNINKTVFACSCIHRLTTVSVS